MGCKYGIKVPTDSSVVRVISIVRTYDPLPIREIKRRVVESDYLLTCDYPSDWGVESILYCYYDLLKQGIIPCLFENDCPINVERIADLDNAYQELATELAAESDEERDIDEDLVFQYELSDAWEIPLVSVSVYNRSEDNIKCIVWYAPKAPRDLPLNSNYSVDVSVINQVYEIIRNNNTIFDVDTIETPPVLDGFGNKFTFKDGDDYIWLSAYNISAWNYDVNRTIEGRDPINAKLVLDVFERIKQLLVKNGVEGRYLILELE